jgi:hypothetical protein
VCENLLYTVALLTLPDLFDLASSLASRPLVSLFASLPQGRVLMQLQQTEQDEDESDEASDEGDSISEDGSGDEDEWNGIEDEDSSEQDEDEEGTSIVEDGPPAPKPEAGTSFFLYYSPSCVTYNSGRHCVHPTPSSKSAAR